MRNFTKSLRISEARWLGLKIYAIKNKNPVLADNLDNIMQSAGVENLSHRQYTQKLKQLEKERKTLVQEVKTNE